MGDGNSYTDVYDPYPNRVVKKPLANWEAFVTVFNSVIGTGLFAMPLAFANSGYIHGTILTIATSILLIYGMQLLIMCMMETSRRNQVPYMTLSESVAYAVHTGPTWCRCAASASGCLTGCILCLSQYGISVTFHVYIALAIVDTATHFHMDADLRIVCVVVGILLYPMFLIRHLKYLVISNIISSILICGALVVFIVYLSNDLPPLTEREMIEDLSKLPLFFAIAMFTVTSVGVMIVVEGKMSHPQAYIGRWGILNFVALPIVIANISIGFVGYWRFGDSVNTSVTTNVPEDKMLLIRGIMAISVFLTYPIVGYVVIDLIMTYFNRDDDLENANKLEYIFRTIFVLMSTLNAIAYPKLGPVVILIGALSISVLNLICPCLLDICLLSHRSYGRLYWRLWKDLIIIAIGLMVLGQGIVSTYWGLKEHLL